MRHPAVTAALVLVLLLAGASAAADPSPAQTKPTHVVTELPRLLCVPPAPSTTCRDLPPGHFVDAATWSALDAELRRAHDEVTHLRAANDSLRAQMRGWSPGWRTVAVTLATGVALGVYAHWKL